MNRLVPIGRFLFRFRNWIFPAVVLLALLFSGPQYMAGDPKLDVWMDGVGVIIALLGLLVRAVTIGYEYIVRGGRNRQVYADDLVQGGVYAVTRNPMYLGNGLLVIGCAVIINAPAFYAIGVPFTLFAYASIIAAEEAYLRDRFGARFDDYCARVNRILPRLSEFPRAIEGMKFNWQRLTVKEYNTLFLGIVEIIVLCVLDDLLIERELATPALGHALLLAAPFLALYVVVWVLKKTGRLRPEVRVKP